MIERTDNCLWTAPEGAQDIGESLIGAVRREVHEETGLTVEVTGLSGTYSDPKHVIEYDHDEVRQEFLLCFHTRPSKEIYRLAASPDESTELSQETWPASTPIVRCGSGSATRLPNPTRSTSVNRPACLATGR